MTPGPDQPTATNDGEQNCIRKPSWPAAIGDPVALAQVRIGGAKIGDISHAANSSE